jgi:hypothetical protein
MSAPFCSRCGLTFSTAAMGINGPYCTCPVPQTMTTNTTNPDAPAMPVESHNEIYPGLTAREHAGILLLQPTGTPWLDEMIHARRRDELAKAALSGFLANPTLTASRDAEVAEASYKLSDAMLAALNNPAATRPAGNGEGKQ